ncbi:MAG: pyridoxal phosphate-dependent aminotransferase [Pirellulales bacterium]
MPLNQRLVSLEESASVALADRVRRLQASGRKVIALQTGDPDFPTPGPIVEAACRAIEEGQTHYCNSRGLPELRRAIADNVSRMYGAEYDPESEILVTCGGIHAYYCALMAILGPGDEVLVADPAWMPHANTVRLVGGRAVRVPAPAENGFFPALADWEQALTSRTKALLVNSPNNPTGAVASGDYLGEIVQFAAAHDLYIISDEVYHSILYDGRRHTCVASLPGARSRTLLLNSLSKTYAMTGWRVGFLAAPSQVIEQALKASQHSITNLAPFVQKAAAFALTDSAVASAAQEMAMAYESRKRRVMQLWREAQTSDVGVYEPQGAFYFFLDLRALTISSVEAAASLLEDRSVAMVPGSAYGPCGEGFLRMTIAAADAEIEAGFTHLLDWARLRRGRIAGRST